MKCKKIISLSLISALIGSSIIASYGGITESELQGLISQYTNGKKSLEDIKNAIGLNLDDVNKYINANGTLNEAALRALDQGKQSFIKDLLYDNGFFIGRDKDGNLIVTKSDPDPNKNINVEKFTELLKQAIQQPPAPQPPSSGGSSGSSGSFVVVPSGQSSSSTGSSSTKNPSSSASTSIPQFTKEPDKTIDISNSVKTNQDKFSIRDIINRIPNDPKKVNQVIDIKTKTAEWRLPLDALKRAANSNMTFSPVVSVLPVREVSLTQLPPEAMNIFSEVENSTFLDFPNEKIPGDVMVRVSVGGQFTNKEMAVYYLDSTGKPKFLTNVKVDSQGKVVVQFKDMTIDLILVEKSEAEKLNAKNSTVNTNPIKPTTTASDTIAPQTKVSAVLPAAAK